MAADTFTPLRAARVLELLGDGSCPFLRIAAQRAGVSRGQMENWLHRGERDQAQGLDTPLAQFAIEVHKIQGEWKARAMNELESADKDTRDGAANKRWLLERLDRETFDISRPAKNAPKGETEKPKGPGEVQDLKKALEDLEQPEPVLQ